MKKAPAKRPARAKTTARGAAKKGTATSGGPTSVADAKLAERIVALTKAGKNRKEILAEIGGGLSYFRLDKIQRAAGLKEAPGAAKKGR